MALQTFKKLIFGNFRKSKESTVQRLYEIICSYREDSFLYRRKYEALLKSHLNLKNNFKKMQSEITALKSMSLNWWCFMTIVWLNTPGSKNDLLKTTKKK